MRKLGASDCFFYYTSAYDNTFSITLSLRLKVWDPEAFREAFEKTLPYYPEFAYRPVISSNQLHAVPNGEKIVLVPEDGKVRALGTDETNGYLFYLTYSENEVRVRYYHGLTDVLGMLKMLTQVLAEYASATSFALTEEERTEAASLLRKEIPSIEELDTDPYRRLGDAKASTDYHFDNPGAFVIPSPYPGDCGCLHSYSFLLRTDEFLEKTRALGVSFVPLLVAALAAGAKQAFSVEEKPFICMVPASMRAVVGSQTLINCSDGLVLPYNAGSSGTMEEACRNIKASMKMQMDRGNYLRLMGEKTAALERFEADPTPIEDLAFSLNRPPAEGAFRPVSCAMTYPGKLSFSSGLDRMLEDCSFEIWVRANYGFAYTFGNKMEFRLRCRSDEASWANHVLNCFREMGLHAAMTDDGKVRSELMDLRKLQHI